MNFNCLFFYSQLEIQMNRDVLRCVGILLTLCLIGAIGFKISMNGYNEDMFTPFLIGDDTIGTTFLHYIIVLQVIIPISLYVTLEVTKIIQLRLMQQDIKMYDENQNKRLECRALNIPEELGQVSDFTKFYSHNLFRIFREIDY